VCGLPVWVITISKEQTKNKKKPVIIITSRVHSGETPASLVFKGILTYLLSDRKEAKLLRSQYNFILIPCLNPDGVVCGNYRNSAAGVDLNRLWIFPDERFNPEIFHTKNLLKRLTEIEKR
jgi:murein tripeptide amidase MpaA